MKLDASSGLSAKEIGIIKQTIKNAVLTRLPELPDPLEIKLFIQGRDAWLFSWSLLNESLPIESSEIICLEVTVNLKKEFHYCLIMTHHNFSCKVHMQEDLYHPKLSVTKRTA